MVDAVRDLFELDWQTILIGLCIILVSAYTIYTVGKQILGTFGIKFSFVENAKRDRANIQELESSMIQINQRFADVEETYKQYAELSEQIQQLTHLICDVRQENELLRNGLYQVIGDAAESRVRFYNKQQYIPESEYDSFCDFLDYAINVMHCNHGLEKRYLDCKSNLPMLSAEEVTQLLLSKGEAK